MSQESRGRKGKEFGSEDITESEFEIPQSAQIEKEKSLEEKEVEQKLGYYAAAMYEVQQRGEKIVAIDSAEPEELLRLYNEFVNRASQVRTEVLLWERAHRASIDTTVANHPDVQPLQKALKTQFSAIGNLLASIIYKNTILQSKSNKG